MKYVLLLFILLSFSANTFSQVRVRLSPHPDTLPHRGSYYITAVTDNRNIRNDEHTIIGGLRSLLGNQPIRLHEPAAVCVKTFYYMVHPKLPADTSAILISLDSFRCTANALRMGKTIVTTTLMLRFIRQSTGEVLYTANSRQEDRTNSFTQPLFRKEIEAGLISALTDFEDRILLIKE